MSKYYRGDRTVSLTIPEPVDTTPPPLPNWPLYLTGADEQGSVSFRVPFLDAASYVAPVDITAAYVPGETLDENLTGEEILALPGVVAAVSPFPPSFGALQFDQNITVQLPAPLPVGPVVVVLLGRLA